MSRLLDVSAEEDMTIVTRAKTKRHAQSMRLQSSNLCLLSISYSLVKNYRPRPRAATAEGLRKCRKPEKEREFSFRHVRGFENAVVGVGSIHTINSIAQ